MAYVREVDMRYVGQEYTVRVVLDEYNEIALKKRFDEIHEMTYAHSAPEEPAEIVTFRLSASAKIPRPLLERIPGETSNHLQHLFADSDWSISERTTIS